MFNKSLVSWNEISWSSLDGTRKQAVYNWHHPHHPVLVKSLVREKDRAGWTVPNLTFKGRHKSDLISFQGNKFYEMSLPPAFRDINQASIGSLMPGGWSPHSRAKCAQSPTIWPRAFQIPIGSFIYWMLTMYKRIYQTLGPQVAWDTFPALKGNTNLSGETDTPFPQK